MRRGMFLLGLALALLLLGGGCGESSPRSYCGPRTRNSLSFQTQTGSGTVDWDGNRPVVDTDNPPNGTCQAALQYDEPPCVDSNAAPPMAFSVEVDCTRNDGTHGWFRAELGNVLELSPGDHQVSADVEFALAFLFNTATVRTKQLSGTTAKYPVVVTPDFDEQVTVDVQSATFNATLHFEVKANQLQGLPHERCVVPCPV